MLKLLSLYKSPFRTIVPVVLIFFLLLNLIITAGCGGRNRNVLSNEDLKMLREAIKSAPVYSENKHRTLDSIKHKFRINLKQNRSDAWSEAHKLSELYRPVNADSSLMYAREGIKIGRTLGDSAKVIISRIDEVGALSVAGLFTAASSRLNSVSNEPMTPDVKIELWRAGRQLYSYMSNYAAGHDEFFKEYYSKHRSFDDSLLAQLPADSRFKRFLRSERLISEGQYREAQDILERLINELPEDHNLYGMSAYQLSEVARHSGDSRETASYLAKAAVSDIKGGVTEGLALPALAVILYVEGDFGESLDFINFALVGARSSNARMRVSTLASMLPDIDKAYRQQNESTRISLTIYVSIALILLVISIVLIFALRKRMKRIRANEIKLEGTSKLQESYIGNFLGMCASYADRLDSLQKMVQRKLSSGQQNELLKIVSSGKLIEEGEGNGSFYKIIDQTILDLYPDFVESVNLLLEPDKKITLKEKGTLSPELRIYAFVKLGVTESSRIAQILHYSSNTVYAYRYKMRKRAINPETFDEDIISKDR